MVQLILLLQAAQDGDGVLHRRLAHEDGLEAALEGGVLFDMLLIFVERGRADAVQLAACKGGLQQIARVHRAFGFARPNQCVHFIDEQNDMAFARLHFIEHTFEAFFKLSAIFGARNQTAHVE